MKSNRKSLYIVLAFVLIAVMIISQAALSLPAMAVKDPGGSDQSSSQSQESSGDSGGGDQNSGQNNGADNSGGNGGTDNSGGQSSGTDNSGGQSGGQNGGNSGGQNGGNSGGSDNNSGNSQGSGTNNGNGANNGGSGNQGGEQNNNDNSGQNNQNNTQENSGNGTNNGNQTYNGYSRYSGGSTEKKDEGQSKKTVSIIYTGDMHSHLDTVNQLGGSARLKTQINKIKEKYPESFIFDAGDFSMGTAFQTIFTSEASELKMLGELGYDAVTVGDHEFGYDAKGLGKMLSVAKESKRVDVTRNQIRDPYSGYLKTEVKAEQFMPGLVCANMDWDASEENKKLAKGAAYLKKSMDSYGASDYDIVERNGVKIAVFGVVAEEAQNQILENDVEWADSTQRAIQVVNEIKRNKEADLIVCLRNSTFMSKDRSRESDEDFVSNVPGIDVMISAHESTSYKEPVVSGDTVIVSAGSNSEYIGNLILKKKAGKFSYDKNKLYKLDKNVEQNWDVRYKVNTYKALINSRYFNNYGFDYGTVLAHSDFNFEKFDLFKVDRQDNSLGNMIADSFVYAVRRAEKKNYERVDASIVPNAEVRSTFSKGDITTSDAFNVLSLGMGRDDKPGYPLVTAYFTGKELKKLAEIDASLSSRNEDVILHTSGLEYNFNDRRLFLNRAIDIRLSGKGSDAEIDNDKLYRVVAGLHTFDILAAVERRSKGLLAVLPKDKNGNEIKDLSKFIVRKGKKEIKEWYALASYIDSFEDNTIPEKYHGRDGRKKDETSIAPLALIKQPNNYGVMLAAALLIPVVILIGIILYIRKRRYSRRGYKKNMFGQEGGTKHRSPFKSRRMGISDGKRNSY